MINLLKLNPINYLIVMFIINLIIILLKLIISILTSFLGYIIIIKI